MSNYSAKERLIASILSATPGLKKIAKELYVLINYILHKKSYTSKIISRQIPDQIVDITDTFDPKKESFGGYYDKPLMNKQGQLLSHIPSLSSRKIPSDKNPVKIVLTDIHSKHTISIDESYSYNWQQGTRLHWLNENHFIFNFFDEKQKQYGAKVYSTDKKSILREYPLPVQESFKDEYYLALNYSRLMSMRPDYGYRNLPKLTSLQLNDLQNDGIWKVNFNDSKKILLHSLSEVMATKPKALFSKCNHNVNHLMINHSGTGFMFIHRYYLGERRFDRLLYSDFKNLRVVLDEEMVSHCCWIDDENIFGYFKNGGKNGYYTLNIVSMEIKSCAEMTNLGYGDGHPSCFNNWIAFDSYPDKSRMQTLSLFNLQSKKIIPLVQVYQSIKYKGETRCDLHPRFSTDGKYLTFDSVYKGKRRHCFIDVSKIVTI
jgi:hypothetical protein